ncbi:uncharacterized protein LOC143450717 [Clavelina lepadiformis]|uniref:uncharacterized protein LOC143450717 n=1 Tax=Clavelina lepadiformis TaxID=159417 RepID=UPI004042C28D
MAETLTYADRVKRQWNNDVAEEYSNHCEVTIQLTNDSKREDIYKMLKESMISFDYIEGIIQRPGNMVNITLDRKNNAIRLADILRKRPEVNYAIAHGDDRIDLTIRWVPIRYPQRHLDEILKQFEIQGPARLGVDNYGIRDGRRIYKVNKKTMERHQLPSYLYLGKIRCAVSYNGQIQTCSYCTEQGHKFKECPKRCQENTNNPAGHDVPMTTARILKSDEEPSPSPNENHKEAPDHTEKQEPRREGKSGRTARKSRAKTELSSEKSQEPDSDEQPSEREESESRGNKRKNISGESKEDQEKTEVQRGGDCDRIYDLSSRRLESGGLLGCFCGDTIQIKRNKDSRASTPDFEHPVYCAGCTAAFIRCKCSKFSIIRLKDRLEPFQCIKCKCKYEPNPDDLNSTVN